MCVCVSVHVHMCAYGVCVIQQSIHVTLVLMISCLVADLLVREVRRLRSSEPANNRMNSNKCVCVFTFSGISPAVGVDGE